MRWDLLRRSVPAVVVALLIVAGSGSVTGAAPAASPPSSTVALALSVIPRASAEPIQFGYDIAQPGRAWMLWNDGYAEDTYGAQAFGSHPFRVLRMPLYPGVQTHATSAPDTAKYDAVYEEGERGRPIVQAASTVLSIDPHVAIYADLTYPLGKRPFPNWFAGNFAHRYSNVIVNYLRYMHSKGIPIAAVGIFCEQGGKAIAAATGEPRSPHLLAKTYIQTVEAVAARIKSYDRQAAKPSRLALPAFVGPDSRSPNPGFQTFIASQPNPRALEAVATTHYYSKTPATHLLESFSAAAAGAAKWDTEFHWNTRSAAESPRFPEYDSARAGLLALFENIDDGVTGISWWHFQLCSLPSDDPAFPDCSALREIESTVVDSMSDAVELPLATPAITSPAVARGVVVRGFRRGSTYGLWVMNNRDTDQTIKVRIDAGGAAPLPSATGTGWVAAGTKLWTYNVTAHGQGHSYDLQMVGDSFDYLQFTLQ